MQASVVCSTGLMARVLLRRRIAHRRPVSFLNAPLSSCLRRFRRIRDRKRGAILIDRLFAIAFQVVHAPEIDVRPGECIRFGPHPGRFRMPGRYNLLKERSGIVRVALQ